MRALLLLAVATAACTRPGARHPDEPDDVIDHATPVQLVGTRATLRGALDERAGDTVDWFRLDRAPQAGRMVVEFRSKSNRPDASVWVDFSDNGDNEVSAYDRRNLRTPDITSFHIKSPPAHMFIKIYGRPSGAAVYDLEFYFVPDIDWTTVDIPDPPSLPAVPEMPIPELPYCKEHENTVDHHCRPATPCKWSSFIDVTNWKCDMKYMPPPGPHER